MVLLVAEDVKLLDGVRGGVRSEPERRGEELVPNKCECESEAAEDLCERVGDAARSRGRK